MKDKSRKMIGEDEAMRIAIKNHPQWRKQYERGTLPDRVIDEYGQEMSPRAHIAIHSIIER